MDSYQLHFPGEPMRHYKVFRSVFLFALLLFTFSASNSYAFFTASEISDLKKTPLPADRSVTFGNLLDTYKFCKGGKWTLEKTERGQKYVEFRGEYSNLALVQSRIKSQFRNVPDSVVKEIAQAFDSAGFKIELVAQFMIAADGKSYQSTFLGFDYKGDTPRVAPATIDRGFRQIYQNQPFTETLPSAGIKGFDYHFKKYILSKADKKTLQIVGVLPSNRQMAISWEKMPIVIYQIDGFKFDDRAERITLSSKGAITDLVPEKTSDVNYYAQGTVSHERFSQESVTYGILQNASMELFSVIKDNELRLSDFRFVSSNEKLDASEVQLTLRDIDPMRLEISHIRYGGPLSDKTRTFIQQRNDEAVAAKQAEQERIRAENLAAQQAYEDQRRNLRGTPEAQIRARQEREAKARETKEALEAKEAAARAALLGSYTNKENGSLVFSESKKQDNFYHVAVSTVTRQGKPCNFEGECQPSQNGGFICTVSTDRKGNKISLSAKNDILSFSDYEYAVERLCRGSVDSRHFKKVASQTAATSVVGQASTTKKGTPNTGAYAYQQEGLTGELLLNAQHESPEKYYLTVATSSGTGNTCEFEGDCIVKGNELICSNENIKEDKDNYIAIRILADNALELTKSYAPLCGPGAYLDGTYKPKCLDKVLETKTVSGTYLGWFEPEEGFNTIGVKLNDGTELYIVASEEEANTLFGNKKGQTVSVTYNVEQMWVWGECSKVEVLKK